MSNVLTAVSTPTDAFPSTGPSGRLAHPGSGWPSPMKPYGRKPQDHKKGLTTPQGDDQVGSAARLFPFARGVGLLGDVALSERGSKSYSDEVTHHRSERRHAKAALHHIAHRGRRRMCRRDGRDTYARTPGYRRHFSLPLFIMYDFTVKATAPVPRPDASL